MNAEGIKKNMEKKWLQGDFPQSETAMYWGYMYIYHLILYCCSKHDEVKFLYLYLTSPK